MSKICEVRKYYGGDNRMNGVVYLKILEEHSHNVYVNPVHSTFSKWVPKKQLDLRELSEGEECGVLL